MYLSIIINHIIKLTINTTHTIIMIIINYALEVPYNPNIIIYLNFVDEIFIYVYWFSIEMIGVMREF